MVVRACRLLQQPTGPFLLSALLAARYSTHLSIINSGRSLTNQFQMIFSLALSTKSCAVRGFPRFFVKRDVIRNGILSG